MYTFVTSKLRLISFAQKLLLLRNRHFLLIDLIICASTPTLALLLRVEKLHQLPRYAPALISYTLVALGVRLAIFVAFGLYRRYWHYASSYELGLLLVNAFITTLLTVSLFMLAHKFSPAFNLPYSLPLLDALLAFLAIGGSRAAIRFAELWQRSTPPSGAITNVVIMGAGHAGDLMVREILKNPQLNLCVVAFLDDNPLKHGVRIHGVPVLGGRAALPALIKRAAIGRVIIAMPTAPGKEVRQVVEICRRLGVPTQTVPGLYELLNGSVDLNQLRKVQIEDLLRRAPIQTDTAAVHQLLRGKRVLVTGAGGSIGSELCRQILRCQPEQLLLIGHGENSIFEIHNELQRSLAERQPGSGAGQAKPVMLTPVIADLRFAERIEAIFQQYQPQVVFHAAAHKHVPLMELHPSEAITNNVVGTRNLLAVAQKLHVERFVMISTDKAVNPTSIMGASKRTAELLVHQAARQSGRPYQVVRFGNVLGSRGSVVHTFRQQIANGGPVTVTHPEMVRYFMTIPEAVQLLLQASVLGKGGEVFMLDMGEPVKIVDLARDLITLSGLEIERDIEITFIGLRPGEKLYEEMFTNNEQYQRTSHEKVLVAANASHFIPKQLEQAIDTLVAAAWRDDQLAVRLALQALVPEYQPSNQGQAQPSATTSTSSNAAPNINGGAQRVNLPLNPTPALKPSLGV